MLISPIQRLLQKTSLDAKRYGKLTSAWICVTTAASQSVMAAEKHLMVSLAFSERETN